MLISYSRKVFIPLTKLCRDVCSYCTFAQAPQPGKRAYLTADEVLAIARQGARMGCHEALFTLGEAPEEKYKVARDWLDEHGYASTVEYLAAMCRLVLDETGLLPHANAGALSRDDLAMLRPVSPSQGMMVETLRDINGSGLAAPQVHIPLRVVIFHVPAHRAQSDTLPRPQGMTALVNPVIEPLDDMVEEGWEGCLSVPGMRGVVPRFTRLRYSGFDQYGTRIERDAGRVVLVRRTGVERRAVEELALLVADVGQRGIERGEEELAGRHRHQPAERPARSAC